MIHRHQGNQRGFTLLEVLIALLVLSIGLLGLAALQTVGLRSNQMASMRTQAIQATYDISDRMRANPEGVDNQEYTITVAEAPADTTATGQALTDLTEWRDKVEVLPGGRSQIVRSTVSGVVIHTITVFWDEERTGATGTACGPDPDVDLRCMTLTL
ncbi:MAG: type IV pilus modification protein PilV [Gammaproteobacteria bacterium]|jgi:type IV pilus assembly protein PilV